MAGTQYSAEDLAECKQVKRGGGVFQVVLGAVEKNKAGTGHAGRGCDFKEGMEEGVRQQRPEGGEEAASRAGVGEGGF